MITNTPLPIAWRVFNEYATRHGFEGEDFELFVRMLKALDGEYLKVMAELAAGVNEEDQDDG